jgi:hypothetical protein
LYVLRSLSEPCDSWIKVRRGVEREEKIREEKRREEKRREESALSVLWCG